jgi:hypothetical protein
MTSPCTLRVTPDDTERLRKMIEDVPDKAVLCLGPGIYRTTLWLSRSITIRGTSRNDVVIDGGGTFSTVQIVGDSAEVVLESLTLRNGSGGAPEGGNLTIFDSRSVKIRDVAFLDGTGESTGAVFIRGGLVTFDDCAMVGNTGGDNAQALYIYQGASARLTNCFIAGNRGKAAVITADQGAKLELNRSTVLQTAWTQGSALRVIGRGSQAPTVTIERSILGGHPLLEIHRGGEPQPKVTLDGNALSETPSGEGLIMSDNIVGELRLDANYRPLPGSRIDSYGALR